MDALSNIVAILRQRLTPDIQALFDNLAQKRSQLASLSYQGIGNRTLEAYRNLITTLEQDIQQLETDLSNRSTEFRLENQPITIEAVQQVMPQDTALVEYILYKPFNPKTNKYSKPRYAAYILHLDGEPQAVDLGEAETIDKQVANFRGDLSVGEDLEELAKPAQQLYQLIFQPLLPLLKNTNSLFISPDSQLNLIPFAALQDNNGQYLVENYSLTYLTSGRDLLKLQNPVNPRSSSVIVANPDYGADRATIAPYRGKSQRSADLTDLNWCCDPLAGTKAEAEAIIPLLPQPQVYTEEKALVEVITQVNAPTILHLATHGFFLPDSEAETPASPNPLTIDTQKPLVITSENPLLRSGLAFAGFNPSNDRLDGALTALQAASLDLWGTKLVVLSACQTGVGDVRNGEGVYGLRRALVLAGAESQLMSLWDVSDEGTKELMVKYYQKLTAGEGRSDALREVQLEMLGSEEYRHPFYWSAFIPSGDWRSIDW